MTRTGGEKRGYWLITSSLNNCDADRNKCGVATRAGSGFPRENPPKANARGRKKLNNVPTTMYVCRHMPFLVSCDFCNVIWVIGYAGNAQRHDNKNMYIVTNTTNNASSKGTSPLATNTIMNATSCTSIEPLDPIISFTINVASSSSSSTVVGLTFIHGPMDFIHGHARTLPTFPNKSCPLVVLRRLAMLFFLFFSLLVFITNLFAPFIYPLCVVLCFLSSSTSLKENIHIPTLDFKYILYTSR